MKIRFYGAKLPAAVKVLPGQAKAQVLRFARLTVLSAFAIWVANGKHVDASAAWGALVGGGEVVLRSWRTTQVAKLGLPVSWPSGPPTVPDLTALASAVLAPANTPADTPAPAPVAAPVTPAAPPAETPAPAVVPPPVAPAAAPPAAV